MVCWPSVALLRMFAFVVVTIVREHVGQIPVQRYVTLAHVQAMCLHCVCIVLEALVAWRGVTFYIVVA